MEWVRLDPGSELIAEVELRQPEAMLAGQLERSKDVQAQSAAVAGPGRAAASDVWRGQCAPRMHAEQQCLLQVPHFMPRTTPSSAHAQLKDKDEI